MTKLEMISRIAAYMREKNIRKAVSMPKQVFHISDNEGNTKDFTVRQTDKTVAYNTDDIAAVLDACLDIIKDALQNGEEVSVRGFGALKLQLRGGRWTKHPVTGEHIDVAAKYLPKFTFGNDLRICAQLYELSLKDEEEARSITAKGGK